MGLRCWAGRIRARLCGYETPSDTISDNDTEAVQGAIDRAIAAGGREIVLPEGTFSVTSLTLGDASITMRGAGIGATTIVGTGNGGATVDVAGTTKLNLRDMTITAGTQDSALRISGTLSTYSTIRDVKLNGGTNVGGLHVTAAASALSMLVQNLTVSGGKYGIYLEDVTNLQNTKFIGYRASNTGGDGSGAAIYARNVTGGQPDLEFYGATIEGNNGRAVDWLGGGVARFFGGHCENNNKSDTTWLRGEFEIGGDNGGSAQLHFLVDGMRIGQQYGSHQNPRFRIVDTHTQLCIQNTNWIAAYRIALDSGTSISSQVVVNGLPCRVQIDSAGAFRVVQNQQPCGEVTIEGAATTADVDTSGYHFPDTDYVPVVSVTATDGTPAAGSTTARVTSRVRGSLGAITHVGDGPTITDAAAPEASRPDYTGDFELEITETGARNAAKYRYRLNGGAYVENQSFPANGRIRLTCGIRLDVPAGTYTDGETYTAMATRSSMTIALGAAPGAGNSVTVGWAALRVPA